MTSLRAIAFALSMFTVACSSSGGGMKTPDAAPVNTMITITGTTSEIGISGSTPLAGVNVQAFREGETTAIATAMSAADGTFTLTAATNGTAIDGYVLAQKNTYVDTYLYPPAPLSADFSGATVLMLTPSTRDLAGTISQVSIDTTKAFIGMKVVDSTNADVAGATVTANPASGTIRYNGTSGTPDKNATATAADGIGYVMNEPAGQVTVGAAKSGATFHSHAINARAGVITLTVVQ